MQEQLDAPGRKEYRDDLRRAVEQFLRLDLLTDPRDRITAKRHGLVPHLRAAATAWGSGLQFFSHMLGEPQDTLGAFVPSLVESGFRAVAIDAPAHATRRGSK